MKIAAKDKRRGCYAEKLVGKMMLEDYVNLFK